LFWPIDAKLGVCAAYIKGQLRIATQVSLVNVKVNIANNRNLVLAQKLEFALAN
jgi:hypothetical protein